MGEEYEFRLLPEDMKRLGRRSGLLPLTMPVGDVAQLGVSEIKLGPKTFFDMPHQGSVRTFSSARLLRPRSRSLTQGA